SCAGYNRTRRKNFLRIFLTQDDQKRRRIQLPAVQRCRHGDQKLGAASAKEPPNLVHAIQRQMREGLVNNEETITFGFRHRHEKNQSRDHLLAAAVRGVANLGWRLAVKADAYEDAGLVD